MASLAGITNFYKLPDLRRRVLFTLGMLAVYRIQDRGQVRVTPLAGITLNAGASVAAGVTLAGALVDVRRVASVAYGAFGAALLLLGGLAPFVKTSSQSHRAGLGGVGIDDAGALGDCNGGASVHADVSVGCMLRVVVSATALVAAAVLN